MKKLKLITLSLLLALTVNVFAGVETATIKTSAQCDMCKSTVETAISKLDGVKKVTLNPETKELKVKYDDAVISLASIKTAVSGTGYWADEVMPDKAAYDALPSCCKPVKSCCANKASCSKDGEKKECSSSEGVKKECSKDGSNANGTATPSKTCTGHGH